MVGIGTGMGIDAGIDEGVDAGINVGMKLLGRRGTAASGLSADVPDAGARRGWPTGATLFPAGTR